MKPISSCIVAFEKLPRGVRLNGVKIAARKAGKYIAEIMRRLAPHGRTGKLADDIKVGFERGASVDVTIVKVGPSKKTGFRAHFVDAGTKAHRIRARRSRVLVNKWTGMTFGSKASIPAIPAHPFIEPALEASRDEAAKVFSRMLDEQIKKAFQ